MLVDLLRVDYDRGGAFAIAMDDVIAIRRLQALPGGRIHVKSDNPDCTDFTVNRGQIRIIGQPVWFRREWQLPES